MDPTVTNPELPGRGRRWLWTSALVLLLSLATMAAVACVHQLLRADAADRLLKSVDRLVLLSPNDCTRAEWQVAVYHTHNLHCALIPQVYSTRAELIELRASLEDRAARECNLELIDWLWDEYCRITPATARRVERCRSILREQTELVVMEGDIHHDYGSFERGMRQREDAAAQ